MNAASAEIAATAARLVVEEGLEYGPAKRRALKALGLPARTPLPGNDELEAEVRDYIALFCADTQAQELLALRQHAQMWMARLTECRPHLGGAVWRGTATRRSDIFIQLFCDDSKSAEIALIDQRVKYVPQRVTGFTGDDVDALSVHSFCRELGEEVGVHLMVYDYNALRGALKPQVNGRPLRGDLQALAKLVLEDTEIQIRNDRPR